MSFAWIEVIRQNAEKSIDRIFIAPGRCSESPFPLEVCESLHLLSPTHGCFRAISHETIRHENIWRPAAVARTNFASIYWFWEMRRVGGAGRTSRWAKNGGFTSVIVIIRSFLESMSEKWKNASTWKRFLLLIDNETQRCSFIPRRRLLLSLLHLEFDEKNALDYVHDCRRADSYSTAELCSTLII